MATCRICLDDGELESVCGCEGTVKYAHIQCIQQWHDVSGRTHCELCKQPYEHAALKFNTVNTPCIPKCRCSIAHWWIWFGCVIYILHACILWIQTFEYPDDMIGSIVVFFMANAGSSFLLIFIDQMGERCAFTAIMFWCLSFYPLSVFLQMTTFHKMTANVVVTYFGNLTILFMLGSCLRVTRYEDEEPETSI